MKATMQVGEKGLTIIKKYEQGPDGGVALVAYLCPAKVWTLGWGHTQGVKEGDTCTPEQAERWLREDCREAELAVLNAIHREMTQDQFDALVSLVYNIGKANFRTSTLVRMFNTGNIIGAADQFMVWIKATVKGKLVVMEGLRTRRGEERDLFSGGAAWKG